MKLRRLLGRGDPEDGGASPSVDGADGDDLAAVIAGAGTAPDEDGAAGDGAGAEPVTPEATDAPEDEAMGTDDADDAGTEDTDDDAGETGDGGEASEGEEGEEDEEPPPRTSFELADWGARERKMLDDQLGALGVPRAWEASTLVVDTSHGATVDDLIDEIEERLSLDLAPGVEHVTYEVGDWPLGLEERLIEALIEARVPHQRGYQEIAVGRDHEEQVDALIETVTAAWEDEEPTEEEMAGPDAQDVLSELFVTADRLLHDASDRPATVRFDDAAGALTEVGLPFGFAENDWDDVTTQVAALRELLADAESTDEQITDAARDLRTRLRPLV